MHAIHEQELEVHSKRVDHKPRSGKNNQHDTKAYNYESH